MKKCAVFFILFVLVLCIAVWTDNTGKSVETANVALHDKAKVNDPVHTNDAKGKLVARTDE